jgi:hypothetical protein
MVANCGSVFSAAVTSFRTWAVLGAFTGVFGIGDGRANVAKFELTQPHRHPWVRAALMAACACRMTYGLRPGRLEGSVQLVEISNAEPGQSDGADLFGR